MFFAILIPVCLLLILLIIFNRNKKLVLLGVALGAIGALSFIFIFTNFHTITKVNLEVTNKSQDSEGYWIYVALPYIPFEGSSDLVCIYKVNEDIYNSIDVGKCTVIGCSQECSVNSTSHRIIKVLSFEPFKTTEKETETSTEETVVRDSENEEYDYGSFYYNYTGTILWSSTEGDSNTFKVHDVNTNYYLNDNDIYVLDVYAKLQNLSSESKYLSLTYQAYNENNEVISSNTLDLGNIDSGDDALVSISVRYTSDIKKLLITTSELEETTNIKTIYGVDYELIYTENEEGVLQPSVQVTNNTDFELSEFVVYYIELSTDGTYSFNLDYFKCDEGLLPIGESMLCTLNPTTNMVEIFDVVSNI
jgi:hypothetical protein